MTAYGKKREKVSRDRLLLSIFITAIFSAPVFAANPHLNITMTERVYQNTTFAENFTLTEIVKSCMTQGTLNVTNPQPEPVYDIYLKFTNTQFLSTNLTWDSATKFGNQTAGMPGQTIIIYIPELLQGNYSTFYYNVSCTSLSPPVNIDTNYSNYDHGFNRKVLAGYNWTITQSVTNNNTAGLNISNVNITLTAQNVIWNTSTFNFTLEELWPHGDYTNVTGNGSSKYQWTWTPLGGLIPWNSSTYINFTMRAPYSVPFSASYLGLQESITYEVNYLLSNLTLNEVNASSDINFSFEKRISQPSDNELNHNVTWEIRPQVNTPLNISFDLLKVTLWVTNSSDPNEYLTPFGYLNYNYSGTPLKEINATTSWEPGAYWYFNYTDGSNATNPPPIVWMKPFWLIANKNGQIVNYTTSRAGNDVYLKYIYVVNGYWLEVRKNVTNIGEGQYQINITVENIGNGWTPQWEVVTVYDFVPQEFTAWDMQPSPYDCPTGSNCRNQSVSGSDFTGMTYEWMIAHKPNMNSSLGPKFGPDAVSEENYSWSVAYKVNGTGPFKVSQLYIVGLDPLKVDGASASPIITIISGIQSRTNEIIYISIVAFLIAVNVTNLVITHKINKKLESNISARAPPPPKQFRQA
ncbi:MAG: hypothetical protein QXK37_03630 [Candidatus Woesearchaeota archaeon]